jgi:hypothetical protein
MMHEFLTVNSDELAFRCREKVATHPGRVASAAQLQHGIPLFLQQLIRTLEIEQTAPLKSPADSGPVGAGGAHFELSSTAALHGNTPRGNGFTPHQHWHILTRNQRLRLPRNLNQFDAGRR